MRCLAKPAAMALFVAACGIPAGVKAQAAGQGVSAPAAPSQSNNAAMRTFTSTEGRFSVLLPGDPQQSSQQIAFKDGGSATLYQFWVEQENDNVTYMVMYNDYPAEYANGPAKDVLAATRDGAIQDKTLTSDTAIDLNGVPGRAFTVYDADWNYSIHQFLAGKRLYQLIVVSSKDHPAGQAEEFMNSFRIQ